MKTIEDMNREIRATQEHMRKLSERDKKQKEEYWKKQGYAIPENTPTHIKFYRHPDALKNDEATLLWIVVMLGGSIFNARIIIWIVATVIWLGYIRKYKG